MITNNFKIFDDAKSNILTPSYSGYENILQSGFQYDEEIPSEVFNSIIRQNSLFSYCFLEYIKGISTSSVVVQHGMNSSDLINVISNFFTNQLSITNINVGTLTPGSLVYVKGNPDNHLVELEAPSDTSKSYVVSYEYDAGEDTLLPCVRELVFAESLNNNIVNIGLYRCVIDLESLVSNIISNINNYEILLEMKDVDNSYESIIIPLNRLNAIGYIVTQSEYGVSGTPTIIRFHKTFLIGLSNSNEENNNPIIGRYLTIMSTNSEISTCSFNITIKERI